MGVGMLIRLQGTNKILVGKRLGSMGHETWAVPGGHLEFGEGFSDCALRETEEETGIKLPHASFCYAVNTVFNSESHYVTIFMRGEASEGTEPKLMEPNKCQGWEWVPIDAIPYPRFRPLEILLQEKHLPELLSLGAS